MSATITDKVVANLRKRGVTVLTRDQWGSTEGDIYAARRASKPAKIPCDTVFQHITVTLDTGPLTGDFKADCRTVERIGTDRFGSGVSYNWLVDMKTGMVAVGQPLDAKGTHTVNDKRVPGYSYDQNYAARAIAVIGMEKTPLSKEAELSIAHILSAQMAEGVTTKTFDYVPHSHVAYKDCPCDATRSRMAAIRKQAFALLPMRQVETKPSRGKRVDAAIADLKAARAESENGTKRKKLIRGALSNLYKINPS